MNYIKKFEDVRLGDIGTVGGKNASLGQMIADLSSAGVRVPAGFAITAAAYWHYLEYNKLVQPMKELMSGLSDTNDFEKLRSVGSQIRALIVAGKIPEDLAQEIEESYRNLSEKYNETVCDVAIRSSATAEDLPTASFAGQQESFLNVCGSENLLHFYKECLASLFTDRAIVYRVEQKFNHFKVALSVGVQKMVRSDKACSGVAFSLDTESGFKDVVMINAAYGLGESIVKGLITPDEFLIHKPTLEQGFRPIIKKKCGNKETKLIYADTAETVTVPVDSADQKKFSLTDEEILELSQTVILIEKLYSALKNGWSPMDVEWAKDGLDQKIYIVQARPETVHAQHTMDNFLLQYHLQPGSNPRVIASGQSIGQKMVSGIVRIIKDVKDSDAVKPGDILVTEMTDPDWVSTMKIVAGIITQRGGRTCHAAIVSRELDTPAIVGVENVFDILKDGQKVTLDCSKGEIGLVYEGLVPFSLTKVELGDIPKVAADILVNCANPETVFVVAKLPVAGVGLARIEFIMSNTIKIHPMAIVHPDQVLDEKERAAIATLTESYPDSKTFFVDSLAQGMGMIAAAFYPKPVTIRFSDFKTNEYRNLIGGTYFEPVEENPMIGFRGASRYSNPRYAPAFALECAAFKKVREVMGFTNVQAMIPFVRIVDEGKKVVEEMEKHGLKRGDNNLKIIMMCEIPSNVILIDEFSKIFDGFSIGSNDLTQLTLGVDRDSALLAPLFDERDPAVMKMLEMAVVGAQRNGRYCGICGQAPSDYPEIGDFLIKLGINSLSLNQDSVIPFLMRHANN